MINMIHENLIENKVNTELINPNIQSIFLSPIEINKKIQFIKNISFVTLKEEWLKLEKNSEKIAFESPLLKTFVLILDESKKKFCNNAKPEILNHNFKTNQIIIFKDLFYEIIENNIDLPDDYLYSNLIRIGETISEIELICELMNEKKIKNDLNITINELLLNIQNNIQDNFIKYDCEKIDLHYKFKINFLLIIKYVLLTNKLFNEMVNADLETQLTKITSEVDLNKKIMIYNHRIIIITNKFKYDEFDL